MAAALVGYLIGVGALQSAAFITPVALNTALGLVRPILGGVGPPPGYRLDGPTLRRWTRCRFGANAAAGYRRGPASAGLVVRRRQAGRALRAGVPSWARHAGDHGVARGQPGVECCPRGSPASRPTGRGGGAASERGALPRAGEGRPDPIYRILPDTSSPSHRAAETSTTDSRKRYGRNWLENFHPGTISRGSRRTGVVHGASGAARGNPEQRVDQRCAGPVSPHGSSRRHREDRRSRASAPTSLRANGPRNGSRNSSTCSLRSPIARRTLSSSPTAKRASP